MKPATATPEHGTSKENPAYVAALQTSDVPEIVLEGIIDLPTINGRTVRMQRRLKVFVDGGSSHSFFDDKLASELHLDRLPPTAPTAEAMGGHKIHCGDDLAPVRLHFGALTTKVSFLSTELRKWDALLGRDWLGKENPDIDWQKGTVVAQRHSKRIPLPLWTNGSCNGIRVLTIDVGQLQRELRRADDAWLVQVYQTNVTPTAKA